MKVGVTGATGHIGLHICKALVEKGQEVVALVHHQKSIMTGVPMKLIRGNLLDQSSLMTLMEGCDAVIHAAGLVRLGYKFDREMYDVNVTGTQNVLEAARISGVQKVVHLSSVHVFDQQPVDVPIDESRDFVSDQSIFYDRTKREGHILAKRAADKNMEVIIVCPTGVLGPIDYKPSQLGKAVIDIYSGYIPAVVRGGFDFVDVRDVARGVVLALEKGRTGESYILGGGYYTIKQFADLVLELKGVRKRLIELPLFLAYAGLPFVKLYASIMRKMPLYDKAYLDILRHGNREILSVKSREELGYLSRDIRVTLEDTLKWFREENII